MLAKQSFKATLFIFGGLAVGFGIISRIGFLVVPGWGIQTCRWIYSTMLLTGKSAEVRVNCDLLRWVSGDVPAIDAWLYRYFSAFNF